MRYLEKKRKQLIVDLQCEGIRDMPVLNAIASIPRDLFVPNSLKSNSYDNRALPIEADQTISQPYIVAFMTSALELTKNQKVLEIGTGSGYHSAVLATLSKKVFTIERHYDLFVAAQTRFKKLNLHNIISCHGNGVFGWPTQAPFDRIIVTAAPKNMPPELPQQLNDGGVMILPIGGKTEPQKLVKVRRLGHTFKMFDLLSVRFVPLVN